MSEEIEEIGKKSEIKTVEVGRLQKKQLLQCAAPYTKITRPVSKSSHPYPYVF